VGCGRSETRMCTCVCVGMCEWMRHVCLCRTGAAVGWECNVRPDASRRTACGEGQVGVRMEHPSLSTRVDPPSHCHTRGACGGDGNVSLPGLTKPHHPCGRTPAPPPWKT
jgi:hypothetical protein